MRFALFAAPLVLASGVVARAASDHIATYSTQLNSETARKAGVDAETVFRASCNRSFGSGKAHEVVFTPFEAAPSHTCTGEETHITLFKYGHDVRHEGLHILTCARARCVAKQQKDKTFKYIDNTRKVLDALAWRLGKN